MTTQLKSESTEFSKFKNNFTNLKPMMHIYQRPSYSDTHAHTIFRVCAKPYKDSSLDFLNDLPDCSSSYFQYILYTLAGVTFSNHGSDHNVPCLNKRTNQVGCFLLFQRNPDSTDQNSTLKLFSLAPSVYSQKQSTVLTCVTTSFHSLYNPPKYC